MKDTITQFQFCDWFQQNRPNNFSYEGSKALFHYLEDLEDDIGEEINFDPIVLCCEYNEYESLKECLTEYGNLELKTIEDLRDHTTVIEVDGLDSIIIRAF